MGAERDREVARLMLERQAKGLQVPVVARLLFGAYGALAGLSTEVPFKTTLFIFAVFGFIAALNLYFIHLLRRRQRVELVGWLGVAFDVGIVAGYPLIQNTILAAHGLHWLSGFKGFYVLVCLAFVVINAMALRPAYPAVIGIAAVVVHTAMLFLALGDPAVQWSSELDQVLAGPAVGVSFLIGQIAFISLIVAVVFLTARIARKTVEEAVERQAERARLVRQHAASVMEGRLDALRNLVASLSHEMNSPVGAIKSATATVGSAIKRLADQVDDRDERVERLMKLIGETAQIPEEACNRLDAMLHRLTAFSHLDASEVAPVDVNEALDHTVALIPAELRGESRVARDYGARSPVNVAPARLNLALMTIVTNAFEANGGRGCVQISTSEDEARVRIEVADEGPGIAPGRVGRVFEFSIDGDGSSRVKAGLGLPAAYSLIKKHGGDIAVRSEDGQGACFVITLPRT